MPVMPEEVIQALAIKPGEYYIDCTFGRGGHSRLILKHLTNTGRLLAMDRDERALNSKAAVALGQDPRFVLEKNNLMRLESMVSKLGWSTKVAGILMDLGLSSPQLDDAVRGFSFMKDGPLDMRMDTGHGMTAADWLAEVSEPKLAEVLKVYGEERFARRIARAIVSARSLAPITTTLELSKLIESALPARDPNKHPATRSFQAIRIFINRELEELQAGLEQALRVLKPGGRLVVISFHSLEDRIVKRFIRKEQQGGDFPAALPVHAYEFQPRLRAIGPPIRPEASEIAANPRARSAILRVAERVT
ncbi:MAG: 16S rRNA (cytosine(1402)-N(4))-methyltransferase RsmH [Methylococcales bacterium]